MQGEDVDERLEAMADEWLERVAAEDSDPEPDPQWHIRDYEPVAERS